MDDQRRWVKFKLAGALFPNAIADHIEPGDSFIAGDVLLEVETDKATMDVEAQDDGKLAKITVIFSSSPEINTFSQQITGRRRSQRHSSRLENRRPCRHRR